MNVLSNFVDCGNVRTSSADCGDAARAVAYLQQTSLAALPQYQMSRKAIVESVLGSTDFGLASEPPLIYLDMGLASSKAPTAYLDIGSAST